MTKFDLENYTVPAMIRRILKTMKLREVIQIRTTRVDKLLTHFDEAACFSHNLFKDMKNEIVITFALIGFEQKDHMFKVTI